MAIFTIIFDLFILFLLISVSIFFTRWLFSKIKCYIENKRFRAIHEKIELLYFQKNLTQIAVDSRSKIDTPYDCTYGELHIINLLYLLKYAGANKNLMFVDLGSGAGKAVLAASMAFNMQSIGIELLAPLQQCAIDASKQLTEQKIPLNVEFLCGDYFESNLSEADIIYINATALSIPLWDKMILKFKMLPSGVRIITTTRQLPDSHFKPIYRGMELATWGWVSAFVYVKTA